MGEAKAACLMMISLLLMMRRSFEMLEDTEDWTLKPVFLHRICCEKLFEAVQIHVQIIRFTCCLNMAFNFTKLNP